MTDAPDLRHLLVVDDEQDSADALAELLRLALPDWEVIVAYDGAAAVERGRLGALDAVILDLEMPGLDGSRAAAALRVAARGAALVLIAVSGNAAKLDAARLEGVFDHAMLKPLDVPRLEGLFAFG